MCTQWERKYRYYHLQLKMMPTMSTIQCYSLYVAVIKRCTLNLRSCMAIPRTGTRSCALNCIVHGEWPWLERLPLSQDLCPSHVRRIWQLWIGRYTHIPAVALITVHFRCHSKAAVGECTSRWPGDQGGEIFLCKGFTQATPTNPFTSIVDWQDPAHYIDSYAAHAHRRIRLHNGGRRALLLLSVQTTGTK